MVSKETDIALALEILYESGWGGNRYVASLVASGVKKRYPKASIKLTPGGCGSFFEIYVGKERKLVHSKKGGDGEPEYDGCEDFVEKLCKKFQD